MNTHPHRARLPRISVALVLTATALAISACGSDDSTSSTADDGTVSAAAETGVVAESTKNVEAAYAATATGFEPTGPRAAKNKKVLYLTIGAGSPSGTEGVAAAKQAAKALGWDVQIYDGKYSSQVAQEGIRTAVSQRVDGIVLYGIDCASAKTALQQARAAGITVASTAGVDCNEANPKEKPLYDAYATHGDGQTDVEWYEENGKRQADWIIAKTGGKAKVIEFATPGFAVDAALQRGFQAQLAKCSGCSIAETIDVRPEDLGPSLEQKAEQVLLKHPDANALEVAYSDLLTLGVGSAIRKSGRTDDLHVIGGADYAPGLDAIRNNKGNDAGYVVDVPWKHLAAFDALNRAFAGQKVPDGTEQPVILYDRDHNLPASGAFVPEFDRVGAFTKIWTGQAG